MSDHTDLVTRAVSLLEREGFIKEAEAIESQAKEIERLKHIAEHRRPTMDDLLKQAQKTKAAEAEVARLTKVIQVIIDVIQYEGYPIAAGTICSRDYAGAIARKALERGE
jgi:Asp-tRNA(Asn)/Glu-tRNA(Gln) amidotransferase A subunit family amidase